MLDRRSFFGAAAGSLSSLILGLKARPVILPLRAKKIAVLVKVPNELLRFAVPASTLLDDELTKDFVRSFDLQFMKAV